MVSHWSSVCLSINSSVICLSVFSFPENKLSKCQWTFTKLDIFIDNMGIWFGIAYGQILSIFDRVICPQHHDFSFPDNNVSKYQWIFIELGMCIDIVQIWFGIVTGQIMSIFDSYLPVTR